MFGQKKYSWFLFTSELCREFQNIFVIIFSYEKKIQKVACLLLYDISGFLLIMCGGGGLHVHPCTPFLSSSPLPGVSFSLLRLTASPVCTCTRARAFINLVHLKFCFGICLSQSLNQHGRGCNFDRLLQFLIRRIQQKAHLKKRDSSPAFRKMCFLGSQALVRVSMWMCT